jgi:hypothetical protein
MPLQIIDLILMLQQPSNLDTFYFNFDYLYITFKSQPRQTNGMCGYSECFIVL